MNIEDFFDRFNGKRILVVGDVMLDAYMEGTVQRISPEAPVPIVQLTNKQERLGGAANVALNLVAMGARPILCSVTGNDSSSSCIKELLEAADISSEGLIFCQERQTTVKTRVIGNHQQLLRIDSERCHHLNSHQELELINRVQDLVEGGADAIIFEDYNKGVLTPKVIESIIKLAKTNNLPTAVDPKREQFFSYRGVTLFKPNLKELKEGLGCDFSFSEERELFESAVLELESKLNNTISFVTLSEHGVFVKSGFEKWYAKAHIRNIADVSGAGDTVIAVATLCLLVGMPMEWMAEISNLAGGLVCEKSGVVSINKEELLLELKNVNLSTLR
jgi:rfaE bifunctional protein kinase chain/domain